MNKELYINRYLPVFMLYFFFNTLLLPFGLLYTSLLTPVFILWLMQHRSANYLLYFLLTLLPFVIVHFVNGANAFYYIKSGVLLFTVYVFCVTAYEFLKRLNSLRQLYNNILLINILLCAVGVICFFIPGARPVFWMENSLSMGIDHVNRLKLLTYEPSYYSLLLVPLALYYSLKAVRGQLERPYIQLLLIAIPLLLSLSFGVLACLAISFCTTIAVYTFYSPSGKKIYVYAGGCIAVVVVLAGAIYLTSPHNIVLSRIVNIFTGQDTSFKGRTSDAFLLAWQVAGFKSHWWGCGLGQTKLLGVELWNTFYRHAINFTTDNIAIPNAVADTLANFGIIGVVLRMGAEVWLFFRTKVYKDYYRLALFIFIFVYQFTGSFIYNIAEYVIWILAFIPIFEEFYRKKAA